MKFYFFCSLVTFLLGGFALLQTIKELDAKLNGKAIETMCVEAPSFCSRNNRITIDYENRDYSILISRRECVENKFKSNHIYTFMYSRIFDHFITTNRNPEIMIPILLGIFGIGIYCLWKMKEATNV